MENNNYSGWTKRDLPKIEKSGGVTVEYVQDNAIPSGVLVCAKNGKRVRESSFRELVAKGTLTPEGDGLFPGESQTYRFCGA